MVYVGSVLLKTVAMQRVSSNHLREDDCHIYEAGHSPESRKKDVDLYRYP